MIIHKCDKCGVTAENAKGQQANVPENWTTIYYNAGYGNSSLRYEVCEACTVKLGIPKEAKSQQKLISEHLLEILEEIAQGVVEDYQP